MDWEPGARGTVVAGRYRAAGELRRRGMIEATDLEAPPQRGACRLLAVPGAPEAVDAWRDAWREAEGAARLPVLRDVVRDQDGDAWAVLDPPQGTGGPWPADVVEQARRIGAALARTGLDAGDVTAAMLDVGPDGALVVDGAVWLGDGLPPRAAAERIVDLLGLQETAAAPAWEPSESPDPPRRGRRSDRRRPPARRRLVVAGAGLALVAALAALVVPARSAPAEPVAPAPDEAITLAPDGDVLLGALPAATAPPPAATSEIATAIPEPARTAAAATEQEPPAAPETVTVVVTVGPDAAEAASTAPALPPAAPVPDLPVAGAIELPVADD